jgi:flagella basal body P-ring formation protein FlgA
MNRKTVYIVTIICLLVSAQFCQASANHKADTGLEVYLPREITIKNNSPSLGQVSIIRGKESLVTKAGKITLGRISAPGQEIIIDRPTLLSRLACNGIPAAEVTLTGAEKVTVKQQHQTIKADEFVDIASSFLGKNLPESSIRKWEPIQTPKDLIAAGMCKEISLHPRMVNSTTGRAKVRVSAFANGKQIGAREVAFRLKYNCRRAVTLVDIPKGVAFSPENVRIEEALSNQPELINWKAPYGLVAKRRIPANTAIVHNMVTTAKPKVLLKRNKTVILQIKKAGLLVTAIGKTMQKGSAGEYIKVRNIDSQRIIVAKVNEDGTVEPVF